MADIPQFTPVNLLTGFLGSGKTTLLKQMLADPALADTAVLINEFGAVGLDHQLVERIDDSVVLLPSGCICCTVRGELADALNDLHSRRASGEIPAFTRVVIESTGLADPFPVLSTLKAHPVLRHHFTPGNVITTVDAVNGAGQLDTYPESNRQAAIADRLVITKTDLTNFSEISDLTARLRRINPDAEVSTTPYVELLVGGLLDTGAAPRVARVQSAAGFSCEDTSPPVFGKASHGADFKSFVITVDTPIDWTGFGIWLTMLLNRHGERMLRIKGILNISGEDRPVAIHTVQYLTHTPVHLDGWMSEDRRSQIVFIVDGLDAGLIRRSLHAFGVTQAG
jgi:G3E family GTPase